MDVIGQFHAPAAPPPHPPGGKEPRHPLSKMLSGAHAQRLYGRFVEEQNLLPLPRLEPRTAQPRT